MNNAWERAVEAMRAKRRELIAQPLDRVYGDLLSAALDHIVESLAQEVEAEADDLEQIAQDYLDGKHPGKPDFCKRTASDFRERSDAVRQIAPALRARIEQMKEPQT